MTISTGHILWPWVEAKIRSTSNRSDKWLHFLAAHKNVNKLLVGIIKSKLCGKVVFSVCREAVRKYEEANIEDAFRWLKDFRNFSEDTKVNALSEIYERSSNIRRLNWMSQIRDELDTQRKARLLKLLVYNIILNGLCRKIINTRLRVNQDFVPNLSTILLAPFSTCNLNCIGCESADDRNNGAATYDQLDYVVHQAKRLNIFHVMIIGKGEPFYDDASKETLFRLVKKHWDLFFVVFTNGTTLDESDIIQMRSLVNLFTLVSIDGLQHINDLRRGKGVYEKIIGTFEKMRSNKLLYGFSATVTRENFRHILSAGFLNKMTEMGCKIGFYLKFLPVSDRYNGKMMLSESDTEQFSKLHNEAKEATSIPILDPEIFEEANGCRARRGSVIYIDGTTGKVMPCVKTPYAPEECNIYLNPHKDRLLEILKTKFFTDYRKSYTKCSQCSLNLPKELNHYLLNPDISLLDKEKVKRYFGKVVLQKQNNAPVRGN